jgi:hypothetical protein
VSDFVLCRPNITEGVDFDVIAREWRMKWSPDNDKKALQAAQALLTEKLAAIKAIDGVTSVQRVVCGGCMDFKVIIACSADKVFIDHFACSRLIHL